MKKAFLASAVATAFAFAAPAAFAQSSDPSAGSPTIVAASAADAAGGQRVSRGGRAHRNPSERAEARLAYLKTALKITAEQEPQWESFANVMRKQAADMDKRVQQHRAARAAQGTEGAERRSVSAIERLERTEQRLAARSARLAEVLAAARPLYAALSPEQQQIADEMIARQGKQGGHGHRHGGHRGHRGA